MAGDVKVGLTGRGESKYEADLLVNVLTGNSIQTIITLKYINRSGHVHIQLPLKPQYYSTLLYTHSHTLFRMIMHCTVCQQKKQKDIGIQSEWLYLHCISLYLHLSVHCSNLILFSKLVTLTKIFTQIANCHPRKY